MEIPRTELNLVREHVTSAYDLIRRLRPAMLISRDPSVSADRRQQLSPDAPGLFDKAPDYFAVPQVNAVECANSQYCMAKSG